MSNAPLHLFGILALRHEALRVEQLHQLLDEQAKESGTPLGELARRRGILSARQVRRLLELQRTGTFDPDATSFGGLILQNGFASLDEVGLALQAQRTAADEAPPPPLGEILVGMGTLDAQQTAAILAAQRRLRGGGEPGELDFETRLLPALAGTTQESAAAPEPQGWLIQETGDDLGNLFPLGYHADLGRLPEHDVPVPDMAASRDHAVIEYSSTDRRHVISDLDSRNGTFLNGAQLIRPHLLQPGDRIQIGATLFRYVAGGGIGDGQAGIVSRLGQDAARAARGMASRALPILRGAANAAGETALRFLPLRRKGLDLLVERRDALLERLGQASIDAAPDSPGAQRVGLARRNLTQVQGGSDSAVVRWAEQYSINALRQLGRSLVDRGPAPEGGMPIIVDIRDLDAEIARHSPQSTEPATAE